MQAIDGIPDHYHPSYAGEVHYADREIQRLLNGLGQSGQLDNTWVIITSDHGEGLWSHPSVPLSFGHGTHLYDSANKVPFIIKHPSLEPKQIDAVTSSISLFPTILDLLDIPYDQDPKRPSIKTLIQQGSQKDLPQYAYSETQWQKLDKISVRSINQRYIYSYDALEFQQHNRFEGRLPLHEQKILEGPIEELYSYPHNETLLSTLYGGSATQEDWKTNLLPNTSATSLKTALFDWVNQHPQRPPQQRITSDGHTHFKGTPDEMKSLTFHPIDNLEPMEEPDQNLKEQLKSLGYLE